MNSSKLLNVYEACSLMHQGARIRHAGSPMLAAMENHKVYLVSGQFSARMSVENFCEIYEQEHFIVHESSDGIDEKKDEEYYAWRTKSQ
ncbi:MAG: hypothetical protein HUJ55_03330 [Ileibacterium sp.]|nr:hypothetical protein [Ileibacterium sp.]